MRGDIRQRLFYIIVDLLKIDTLWSWIAWLILNGIPRRRELSLSVWQYNLLHWHHYELNVKNCRCLPSLDRKIHHSIKWTLLYLQIGLGRIFFSSFIHKWAPPHSEYIWSCRAGCSVFIRRIVLWRHLIPFIWFGPRPGKGIFWEKIPDMTFVDM